MENVKLVHFLFVLLLAFSACDKDEESKTQTKEEIIVDKNWVITGHTSKENNGPVEDEFKDYDICNADDIFRFSKNGTFEINEGAIKCDPSDPQVFSQGTWSINQDNLIMTENSSAPENLKIVELTKLRMVLSATESFQNNTYVQVLTFSAK